MRGSEKWVAARFGNQHGFPQINLDQDKTTLTTPTSGSCCCCVAEEVTSRGEEEDEGARAGAEEEEESLMCVCVSEIVLPKSFIAGSLTSDIPVCCNRFRFRNIYPSISLLLLFLLFLEKKWGKETRKNILHKYR